MYRCQFNSQSATAPHKRSGCLLCSRPFPESLILLTESGLTQCSCYRRTSRRQSSWVLRTSWSLPVLMVASSSSGTRLTAGCASGLPAQLHDSENCLQEEQQSATGMGAAPEGSFAGGGSRAPADEFSKGTAAASWRLSDTAQAACSDLDLSGMATGVRADQQTM